MNKKFLLSVILAGACVAGSTIQAHAASCGNDMSACTATDNGLAVEMDKGGAAKDNVAEGYKVGQKVPNFSLKDSAGKEHSLADLNKDKVVALVFYNQSCPFVQEMENRLVDFTKKYADKGVNVVAIDAGINNKPEDVAKKSKEVPFPILVNSDSDIAKKFNATRTPEVFLIDKNGVIQYHGMFDNGEPGSKSADSRKSPAQDATDAILAGKEVAVKETESFGCTIKFKKVADSEPAGADKKEKKS